MNRANQRIRLTWLAATLLLLAIGAALLLWGCLPFSLVKTALDTLARDGSFESFTPLVFRAMRWPAVLLGMAFLAAGLASLFKKSAAQKVIADFFRFSGMVLHRSADQCRELLRALLRVERDPVFLFALLGITLVAIWIRLAFIAQPMRYDEAYTYFAFASRSLRELTADYHLPNNHVLHSILVHLTTGLFGTALWSIRLPAFLAGVLLVPATYLAGAALYNRYTALFAAVLVASSSTLIEYSTNARGYSLMALIWLLLIALAAYLKGHLNGIGWIILALLGAAGLYTIPVMLYPFGIVMAWLGLSWLFKDTGKSYGRHFLVYWAAAGLAAGLLAVLAYLPILASEGLDAFTSTRFVESLESGIFTESLLARLGNTWRDWNTNYFWAGSLILAAGFLLSILFHKRLSRHRLHLALPTVLWCAVLLAIQRVAPWPRVWLFLLPLFLIWAAAGTAGLLAFTKIYRVPEPWRRWRLALGLAAVGIALLLSLLVLRTGSPLRSPDTGVYPAAGEIALYLKDRLQPGDVVVSSLPSNYPLRYYFMRDNIPETYFYRTKLHGEGFQRAWLVVNLGAGQTVESVLAKNELQNLIAPDQARLVREDPGSRLYEIEK